MFAPSLLRITCDELLLFEILLKQVSLCEYIPILSCNTRASIATCICRIGQADMVTVDGLYSQMNDHNHYLDHDHHHKHNPDQKDRPTLWFRGNFALLPCFSCNIRESIATCSESPWNKVTKDPSCGYKYIQLELDKIAWKKKIVPESFIFKALLAHFWALQVFILQHWSKHCNMWRRAVRQGHSGCQL